MIILFMLAAKLLSPVTIVLAAPLGFFARFWPAILVGSAAIAFIDEIVLTALHPGARLNPVGIVIGFVAAMLWALLGRLIQRARDRKKAP